MASEKWIERLCGEEEAVKTPLSVTFRDEPATLAATRARILIVRRDFGYPSPSGLGVKPYLEPIPDSAGSVDLDAFREFIAKAMEKAVEDCRPCNNSGLMIAFGNDGSGPYQVDCGACFGDVTVPVYVRVDHAVFNARLFSVPLRELKASGLGRAYQEDAFRPLFIDSEEWRLVVMPMNAGVITPEKYQHAPSFSIMGRLPAEQSF